MSLSNNAIQVYKSLYLNPGETLPHQVHDRVARTIANNRQEYDSFLHILDDNIFRPNSPALMNCRAEGYDFNFDPKIALEKYEIHDLNLFACFVQGLDDSMQSIMQMWSDCAAIYAGGAGVGIPFSCLREAGSPITAGGYASGPLKYMNVVQVISDTVKSGGKSRRAANLASYWYKHPDILEVITCKENGSYNAINISILVDDEFMDNVYNGVDAPIDLLSPNGNDVVGQISTFRLWNSIVKQAWKTGDPGFLFYDTCNRFNALPSRGKILSSNPCGEVLLSPYSCCTLGSVNLLKCLVLEDGIYRFDMNQYVQYVKISTRFLDNVIDKSSFPNPRFENSAKTIRAIGLGIMGMSDMFFKLNIPYGSDESIEIFEEICKMTTVSAFEQSIDLAQEKGSIDIPTEDYRHFRSLLEYYGMSSEYMNKFDKTGIRNSTVTSIAPTGSISISADSTYAFEPCMALIWEKPLVDRDTTLKFFNPVFSDECKERGIELTEKKIQEIIHNKGSIQSLNFPDDMKKKYVTAHDVPYSKKVQMQRAGQRWITLSISSTCNLPNSATEEDVANAYKEAWKSGAKGITVYRDGCKDNQPVNFGSVKTSKKLEPIKRPITRQGVTTEIKTPHGSLFVTSNFMSNDGDKSLFEVFLKMGKIGQLDYLLLDALAKTISKYLQFGAPIEALINTYQDTGGYKFFFRMEDSQAKPDSAESLIDAISKVIEFHFNGNQENELKPEETSIFEQCPQCEKKTLTRSSGCKGGTCTDTECGYSSCG